MKIQAKKEGGVTVVAIEGDLDHFGTNELDSFLRKQEDLGVHIIFVMSAVKYLSSSALRVIFELWRRKAEEKGSISLVGLQEYCKAILKNTGFDEIFALYDSLDEALEHHKKD